MQAELAGIASYPYDGSRLLLPAGYGVLPSIHDQLRDVICNSTCESSLSLARWSSRLALSVRSRALSHCANLILLGLMSQTGEVGRGCQLAV